MGNNFTVILPVLNEQENLVDIIPELKKLGCEIVVCDNGSCDGGIEWLRCYHKDVRLSQGRGTVVDAILRGLTLASHNKVIIMDSDKSHPTSTVPLLVSVLDYCDLVVGSRYTRYGASLDSLLNRLISRGFNSLAWGLSAGVRDRASGFWGINLPVIQGVKIRNTTKPMLEFLIRGRISSVIEIPYTFRKRLDGKSKIGKPFLKEFWGLLLLYWFRYQRPLKFCLVGGSGALIQVVLLAFFTEILSIFYILSAIVAITLVTVWNYLWNNYWTFQKKEIL